MHPARIARTASAAVVAGIAAFSSYSHMVHVALRYGERPEVAYALPFSVDGMLVVASVVMVDDRRTGQPVRLVARVAFTTGVIASVAANIAAAQPQPGARLIAAWPALALLLVVEMLARPARRPAATAADDQPASATMPTPPAAAPDPADTETAQPPAPPPAPKRSTRPRTTTASQRAPRATGTDRPQRPRRPAAETRELAATILADEPHLSRTQLAARLGVSRQWLHELLSDPTPTPSTETEPDGAAATADPADQPGPTAAAPPEPPTTSPSRTRRPARHPDRPLAATGERP